ncbi:hypothetical protein TNCV_4046781 [Trichonephila clavipes]|nr:hypothetical protein TNCV_4046781 [Trichonephila clavipes]
MLIHRFGGKELETAICKVMRNSIREQLKCGKGKLKKGGKRGDEEILRHEWPIGLCPKRKRGLYCTAFPVVLHEPSSKTGLIGNLIATDFALQ